MLNSTQLLQYVGDTLLGTSIIIYKMYWLAIISELNISESYDIYVLIFKYFFCKYICIVIYNINGR